MLRNHLKLALRNLFNRKGYTLLNILGLAMGISCCLLIFQYVAYEKSYESFNPNAGRIIRLRLDTYQQGRLAYQSATVYPAIAPAMKKDFPEIEKFCRLIDANLLLSNDQKNIKFNETKGYYADPSILEMFNIQLVKGNPSKALDGPDKILLSENMARKYFGKEDPIGKRLTVKDNLVRNYQVTGIFRNYPANSHLIINHLVSYSTLGKELKIQGDTSNATETAWGWYDYYVYLQLKPGTDWQKLEFKLPAFCDKYINSTEGRKNNHIRDELYFIPLRDIHLKSNFNQEAEVNGDGKSVSFLFLIAFFIIIIAWINYSNLATARSLDRAKEVGIRKVMGALRFDLISQFLMESLMLNLLALLVAIGAALTIAPSFNLLIGRDEAAAFTLPANYWMGFLSIFLAGTFISGLYPAFILSGYLPITVLKGIFKTASKGLLLRKGLIVGQFATSVILIAGTTIVYQQVNFMRQQQLGANINQTLVLEGAGSIRDSLYQNIFQPFKAELLRKPDIKTITASSSVMGKEIYWTSGIRRLGSEKVNAVTLYHLGVDYDFIPAFDLKLVAGRNFSKEFATDNKAVLINEKALDVLGFKDAKNAINAKLNRGGDTVKIIGVLANYHHLGLQKIIDPMLILLRPNATSFYSIKISTEHVQKTISDIELAWNKHFPSDPFNYFFLDDSFNEQYKADSRFGQVFALFATLAILIACFGLLGLSAYNVLQRTKEIGIRKVLGASIQNLVFVLSKDFIWLVLISIVVAFPFTWWVMNNWLRDFAFRIHIHWWVFAFAGLLAIVIALLTVGFQALKAAIANPVKSLRTE